MKISNTRQLLSNRINEKDKSSARSSVFPFDCTLTLNLVIHFPTRWHQESLLSSESPREEKRNSGEQGEGVAGGATGSSRKQGDQWGAGGAGKQGG